jgi:phosphotransferase system HPr-like phosphotransfer protein
MPFTQADLDAISLNQYQVFFDDLNLGYIVDGTLTVGVAGQYTEVNNVNQFEGTIKMWNRANIPSVSFSVFSNDVETMRTKLMKGQVSSETFSDGTSKIGFGVETIGSDVFAGVLLMTPYPAPSGYNYGSDFRFTKAVLRIEFDNIIASSKETPAEVPLTVTMLPDTTQPTGFEYGVFGNWQASSSTPLGVSITSYQYALSDDPRISLTAATLLNDELQRLECHAHYGTVSSTATTTSGTASATATSIAVVSATGIAAGDFVRITTSGPVQEYARVSGVSGNTLTVERNALGSTAQSVGSGDAVTLITNVSTVNVRDGATWASSDATKATVGNTYQGTGTANKGVIAHVAAGSANITATFNSVASRNLAITAS